MKSYEEEVKDLKQSIINDRKALAKKDNFLQKIIKKLLTLFQ